MDFRHVRAFIAVADALSVTKAAARLHISQPPLSRQIHQLEEELGTALFVRHHHGVTLTDAGRLLLDKARVLESAATDFCETAARTARGEAGTLRVGIGWGLWDAFNEVRLEYGRQRPGVTVEAYDALCPERTHERLRAHELDVVFDRPPFDAPHVGVLPIFREPLQAVLSAEHPLADRAAVALRDLASEPLLMWDRPVAPGVYDRVLALFTDLGVSPRIVPTPGAGPYNNNGLMLVASGKGVYVCLGVPRTSAEGPSGVAVVPISDATATIDVCVTHRRDDSSLLVLEFLRCVHRVFPHGVDRVLGDRRPARMAS